MVIQAAVVEVDGADRGLAVIADKDLGVDEARGILVNLDARIDQELVPRWAAKRRAVSSSPSRIR